MPRVTTERKPRPSRRVCLVLVLILISGLTVPNLTLAQSDGTVRGKVSWCNGNYPAAYLRVTLLPLNRTRSSLSYTDAYGFYYFYNIPGGDYFLQIYRGGNSSPATYRIRVFDQPYTDINPICLR